MTWNEVLRALLCRIYQEWGGDCKELGTEPEGWIAKVKAEYDSKGPPEFGSLAAEQQFLQLLTELEDHLAEPGNTLSPQQNSTLETLIADLRGDLDGGGGGNGS